MGRMLKTNPPVIVQTPKIFDDKPQAPELSNFVSIDEFLSNYSPKRNIDNAFKKWFHRYNSFNPKKTVKEWKELYTSFLNER